MANTTDTETTPVNDKKSTENAAEQSSANATDNSIEKPDEGNELLSEDALVENINGLINRYLDIDPLLNPWINAAIVLGACIVLAIAVYTLLGLASGLIKKKIKDEQLVLQHIRIPLTVTILLMGITTSLNLYLFELFNLPGGLQSVVNKFILSILFFIWAIAVIRSVRTILTRIAFEDKPKKLIQVRTLPLFVNVSFVLVIAILFYVLFNLWKIDMTAWLASAGIVGIAVGFAAKDTVANLISGVFILVDQPYKIGDYVVLDTGERGEVTEIGIRSTRIATRDDVEVTIPNSIMGNSKIYNESGGGDEKFRVRIPVGVAYGSDTDLARKIMLQICAENEDICTEPVPRTRFRSFGNSALEFELLCWIFVPARRGFVVDKVLDCINKAFIANDIEIPYSKHDVYIKEYPGIDKQT